MGPQGGKLGLFFLILSLFLESGYTSEVFELQIGFLLWKSCQDLPTLLAQQVKR